MKLHRIFPLLILLYVCILSCRRELSEPEKDDPIYNDLAMELGVATKASGDLEKELAEVQKGLLKAEPQTGQAKVIRNDIREAKERLAYARQMRQYYELRLSTRKAFARKAYKEAYEKGEDWPDPEEFSLYKTNKRLLNASRVWDDHIKERFAKPVKKKEEKVRGGKSAPAEGQ